MKFLAFILLSFNLFLINKCQDFCEEQFKANLIDSVFSFNDTTYAFRKPKNVWLLRVNETTGKWSQFGYPIDLNELFNGYNKTSFDSAFGVSDYVKCNKNYNPMCDPNFDPTNVIFVFDGDSFHIFRAINERKLMSVNGSDTNIPWKANRANTSSNTQLFKVPKRIGGAVFSAPNGKNHEQRLSVIFSNPSVFMFDINDGEPISMTMTITDNIVKKGNGAILFRDEMIFIFDNEIFKYSMTQFFEDMSQKTWDFFNCDTMTIIASNDMTSTSTETTVQESETTLPAEEETITTPETISTVSPINSTLATTQTSPQLDDSTQSSMYSSDDDSKYRKNMKYLFISLFTLISITVLLVTLFANQWFPIFSAKPKQTKRKSSSIGSIKSEEQ